jgi:hypothetical protein
LPDQSQTDIYEVVTERNASLVFNGELDDGRSDAFCAAEEKET